MTQETIPGVTILSSGGRLEIVAQHLGNVPGFPQQYLKRYVAEEEYLRVKQQLNDLRAWTGETRNDALRNAASIMSRKFRNYGDPHKNGPAMWQIAIILAMSPTFKIVTNDYLNDVVSSFSGGSNARDINIIKVWITHLRRKIEAIGTPGRIYTSWGRGYYMSEDLQQWVKDVLHQIGHYDRISSSVSSINEADRLSRSQS